MGRKRNTDQVQTKKKSGASRRAAARKRQQDPPNLDNQQKRLNYMKRAAEKDAVAVKHKTTRVKFNSKVEDNETAPVKEKSEVKMPIKGLLKKRDNTVSNGKMANGGKKSINQKKVEVEDKIKKSHAVKRKLEKMELDLEASDEEDENNIAKHIYR